ncbi:Small nuclear RNA activating complex, polypeptide 1, 43kDa [Actinomortierella ambigua]|nr:Small nuclear RNA activating complex, polypeptide 1, 43kDa [Actinomortierella ambigua]
MNLSLPNQNATTPTATLPFMPFVPSARADIYTADPRLLREYHQCIVLGHIAVYKRALISDIEHLLCEYAKKDAYDFRTFVDVWKKLRFSIIHMGCTEKHGREAFMNCVYQIFLSYLQDNYVRQIQNAAVYGLYMTYLTQPLSLPKVGIRMTPERWEVLDKFCITACQLAERQQQRHEQQQQQQHPSDLFNLGGEDVAYTIFKLRESNAFLFVPRDDPIGTIMRFDRDDIQESVELKLLELERVVMTKRMDPAPQKIDELDKHDKFYKGSKQPLLTTPIAQQAIRRVQEKLHRGQPLRSMASSARSRNLHHPHHQSLSSSASAFNPFGHLDGQLQTLRGVVANDAGEARAVDKRRGEEGEKGQEEEEGTQQQQQQQHSETTSPGASSTAPESAPTTTTTVATPSTFSSSSPSSPSAIAKGKARADTGHPDLPGGAPSTPSSSFSSSSSSLPSAASTPLLPVGEHGSATLGQTNKRRPTEAATATATATAKGMKSLFSPVKSEIAGDFEELMKQHIKTRWRRLDYAVQGRLDSFSQEENKN